jgi:hypothetical protein
MPVIVKGDGSTEVFDASKLERSLKHAGAPAGLAERITGDITASVHDGMTTTEIYRNAFTVLHKEEKLSAARYSMRRAILDLGPTGFPFEDYISELMRARGYTVQTRVVMPGACAEHEVDVVMKKDGRTIGAELKFHNTPGFKTDLKVALYVKARFDDIGKKVDEGWLITNTKFTENAISYASCAGITLVGWNHPQGKGLADMIQESKLYPVTVLTDLSGAEKERLLAGGVPLCRMIAENPDVLAKAGIPPGKRERIVAESAALCQT